MVGNGRHFADWSHHANGNAPPVPVLEGCDALNEGFLSDLHEQYSALIIALMVGGTLVILFNLHERMMQAGRHGVLIVITTRGKMLHRVVWPWCVDSDG
jgi:hypothetical protein